MVIKFINLLKDKIIQINSYFLSLKFHTVTRKLKTSIFNSLLKYNEFEQF